jgi:hypothetical protein
MVEVKRIIGKLQPIAGIAFPSGGKEQLKKLWKASAATQKKSLFTTLPNSWACRRPR